jgi:hypothetical protein
MTPTILHKNPDGHIEFEQTGACEFVRDLATSVTVAYICANEDCGFAVAPENLGELKES